ncbi:conserved hypothetical protein [Trichinella spiralis]|uniref:hypothetical protein n=1 Tax=Trichinella spiralis TaxID=6334 RepID=UPI0001EFE3A0|nr:conserved hypothetical protein [Trichinella spiralis]
MRTWQLGFTCACTHPSGSTGQPVNDIVVYCTFSHFSTTDRFCCLPLAATCHTGQLSATLKADPISLTLDHSAHINIRMESQRCRSTMINYFYAVRGSQSGRYRPFGIDGTV